MSYIARNFYPLLLAFALPFPVVFYAFDNGTGSMPGISAGVFENHFVAEEFDQ